MSTSEHDDAGQGLDPRAARTLAQLRAAALDLAATKPIEQVSASELAFAADVNRSTFYRNATGPDAVLRDALYAEFNAWRESTEHISATSGSRRASWIDTFRKLAGHVQRYWGVYEAGLGATPAPSPALMQMLVAHFEESARQYFDRNPALLPPVPQNHRPVSPTMYARFIASGIVGVLSAWIESPGPHDHEEFARALETVLPAWLFGESDASAID